MGRSTGAPGRSLRLPELGSGTDPGAWLTEFIRLASEIYDGLAHIHAHGIIHGDLKPANVLIDKAGRAKITDLGTGSLTAAPESRARRNTPAARKPRQGPPFRT